MSQVCSKCSHANPPEAVYCYFDGVILGGHSVNGGPVRAGSQPFPSQFVFPTGQACRNFDQLAVACQQNWSSAVDLLKQGFLSSFLGGIGRADLALAAQEAARFPDQDRGLDQLLAKLPTQVLDAPKLHAEPTEVNLGVLPLGTNRHFELHLTNHGMRLLYGSVVSDCKWLALGDGPGNPQKLFQFGAEALIPVQIRGQHLRAGNKSLEGHLVVESNGGAVTITVRADVPPKPYPDGVLAGATTPRQIAERAHAAPREAAALFESAAVARWFGENGWTYPVQGPSASGVGAVQQFFEALGLSKAPKVEISQQSLSLRGNVGETTEAALEVRAQEKRPVYAYAICDQPWLDVGRTILSGRTAVVQVVVPRIPDRPGGTLQAMVTVTANGNQRFVIPVSLTISGTSTYYAQALPVTGGTIPVAKPATQPAISIPMIPLPVAAPAGQGPPPLPMAALAVGQSAPAPVVGLPVASPPLGHAMAPAPPPVPNSAGARAAPFVPVPVMPGGSVGQGLAPAVQIALHVVPALILALFLLAVLVRDLFSPAAGDDTIPIDDRNARVAVAFDDKSMRFGIAEVPRGKAAAGKLLTFDPYGQTNSTVIRVGHSDHMLGQPGAGQWLVRAEETGKYGGKKSIWAYTDRRDPAIKINITQLVEIIPGEPVEYSKGKLKRFLDTVRVRYILENKGTGEPDVGLRMLVDTLIGDNDGVPFTVPGRSGLVDKMAEFPTPKQVPDFVQVLERADLADPGIVGYFSFKLGGEVEAPSRVLLTQWPGHFQTLDEWDIPLRPFDADSAVVMYWNEKILKLGERREVGFSYGLGSLSIAGGRLGVSVGGSFTPRGDMTVVALVNNPQKGETLTLKLPPGLKLIGDEAKQAVPPVPAGAAVQQSPVTWHVRAEREGTYALDIHSSMGISQKKSITIKTKTLW
jgi:hypothetical protein